MGRRRVLWGAFAAVLGIAPAPFLVASRSAEAEETRFDETYRGRRVVGVKHDEGRSGGGGSGTWHVTVDGRPLHLMRRADGSWMSMIDHYQSYATPLAAARAAVDELGPTAWPGAPGDRNSRMRDSCTPSGGRGVEREHRCGVHA
ncbi:tyrosinase co-factor protein [Streptomyces ipomoeae]|jgi:hypothetical protein|uniref:Tyrosinase co-factor protein n=1 Tax=Streptomyces ipomoeae TaxID=103232 RepID=A0A540Q640_9ACTN|nr:tyrosinase family oxidase copper chaperone [Streptomyces ipomoeae]MDX2694890.1 tyrosinase family oxidase copper chaperone [Streptomyces ipomoeae]MDX2820831.1 tyrosinase family oxidase copper chaperone [Streptomyces ipomoeae]MDX2839333.1 tyrosinase family oxidase copper chaperone [Streptomyces ipomoeae]MDX2873270.1 tyrosinase family oxidase copper chaperone [Streptomyces ipomoeae]MDX2935866.1 tyrosinase family oxidase copper chaperone [Streptomyces ipomoeae]